MGPGPEGVPSRERSMQTTTLCVQLISTSPATNHDSGGGGAKRTLSPAECLSVGYDYCTKRLQDSVCLLFNDVVDTVVHQESFLFKKEVQSLLAKKYLYQREIQGSTVNSLLCPNRTRDSQQNPQS